MKLRLAKSAGFCYGVRRAVELAGEAAASGRPCVMLGSIIHNRDVVGSLARQGLTAVDQVEDVPSGYGVIIRSHGESRETYRRLEAQGADILDATCPNVKRIHHIVARAEEQGRQPVIIGAPDHPEVAAIATSLAAELGRPVSRPALAAALIARLDRLRTALVSGDTEAYLAEYRRRCVNLGKRVRLLSPAGEDSGEAMDVDRDFGLVVRRDDGTVTTVRSGEVSVRGLYGYTD